MKFFRKILYPLANGMALFVLVCLIVISYRRPNIPWDSWAYHLSFSADIFNLKAYSDSFILNKVLQDRYDGFPLVAEFFQGILWIVTNDISSVVLINSVSIVLFIMIAFRYANVNLSILTFGILSIPLVSVHAFSAYIDLFVSSWIAIQFIAAVNLSKHLDSATLNSKCGRNWAILFMASSAIAGNSKMWAPVIGCSISAFLLADACLRPRNTVKRHAQKYILLVTFLAAFMSCATLMKNSFLHDNPVYPIAHSSKALGITLPGPEPEYKNYPEYAEELGLLGRSVYFLTSASEYDWIIRGVEPDYRHVDGVGDAPKRYSSARTGGWWGLQVLVSLFLVVGLWIICRYEAPGPGRISGFPLKLFFILTLVTSIMPQSHELRYFLYWPVLLIYIIAYMTENTSTGKMLKPAIIVLYFGLFLASLLILRSESLESLSAKKSQAELIGVVADADEIATAKKLGGICLGPDYNPDQFKYSSVFHGGNYIVEQGWFGCKYLPAYVRK